MKKTLNALFLLSYSAAALAGSGNESGHGGDQYRTRIVAAKKQLLNTLEQIEKSGFDPENEKRALSLLSAPQFRTLKQELLNAKLSFVEQQDSRAARAFESRTPKKEIEFYLPVIRATKLSPEEAFVLVAHEAGHLFTTLEHGTLDEVGAVLLDQYRNHADEFKALRLKPAPIAMSSSPLERVRVIVRRASRVPDHWFDQHKGINFETVSLTKATGRCENWESVVAENRRKWEKLSVQEQQALTTKSIGEFMTGYRNRVQSFLVGLLPQSGIEAKTWLADRTYPAFKGAFPDTVYQESLRTSSCYEFTAEVVYHIAIELSLTQDAEKYLIFEGMSHVDENGKTLAQLLVDGGSIFSKLIGSSSDKKALMPIEAAIQDFQKEIEKEQVLRLQSKSFTSYSDARFSAKAMQVLEAYYRNKDLVEDLASITAPDGKPMNQPQTDKLKHLIQKLEDYYL